MGSCERDTSAPVPAPVLEAVAAAWERAHELAATGVELHFHPPRGGGRVQAELRRDGVGLASLTPAQALAIACGDVVPGALPGACDRALTTGSEAASESPRAGNSALWR